MIYFLQPTDCGPVKIGHSSDVAARTRQLEAHYGQPLAILATMDGDPDREQEIHTRFAHLRFGRTEQFRPAADLMAFIDRPLLVDANPDAVEAMEVTRAQASVINLKGSEAYRDWLSGVSKKTHLAKAVIIRLALKSWAQQNGHQEPSDL